MSYGVIYVTRVILLFFSLVTLIDLKEILIGEQYRNICCASGVNNNSCDDVKKADVLKHDLSEHSHNIEALFEFCYFLHYDIF